MAGVSYRSFRRANSALVWTYHREACSDSSAWMAFGTANPDEFSHRTEVALVVA